MLFSFEGALSDLVIDDWQWATGVVCCELLVEEQEAFRDKRKSPNLRREYGGVAQLGEHLPCKQGVRGSNPLISTKIS